MQNQTKLIGARELDHSFEQLLHKGEGSDISPAFPIHIVPLGKQKIG